MTRSISARAIFTIAAVVLALVGGCRIRQESADEPRDGRLNVVLITIDTLRADALGAYQEGLATSPNIDQLAREGVLFERCSTSSPNTVPSHATILTGLHPYAHGVRANAGYMLAGENYTLAEAFRDAGYASAAETAHITRRVGLDQGFAQYRDVDSHDVELKQVRMSGGELTFEKRVLRERPASDITQKGVEFLQRNREQAFFLWLHYYDPNWAYAAPREFAQRFPDNPYYGEVAYVDFAVGQFLLALRQLGLADRTLVVLTADHGEGLGDHGENSHAFFVYESTIHVPLVIWGTPGLSGGRRVAAPVRTLDIASTVLDLAGLDPLPKSQGVSLRGQMEGREGVEDLVAYGESIEAYASFGGSVLRFIRVGPWKYIHKARPELYHVDRDPEELSNRAAEAPERVAALREQLTALLARAPAAPSNTTADVDPEALAQLRALGYLGDPSAAPIEDELATLDVSGLDVSDALEDLKELSNARAKLDLTARTSDVRQRELESLVGRFEALAERYPNGMAILRGWIGALRELERYDEALPLLARAVELAPQDTRLRLSFVKALRAEGDLAGAEAQARAALLQNPCGEFEIAYLSGVLNDSQRYAERRNLLTELVAQCDSDGVRNEYAYFLATCADDLYRDGALALELAAVITSNPGGMRLEYVDTLAAALAETGDLAGALATQQNVVARLEQRGASPATLATFREHLRAYEAGEPLREP